jgi:DNA-binding MurR/RpiR family transcriptional regulator
MSQIVTAIQGKLTLLSRQERVLAQYIIAHPEQIASLSIVELAQLSGISAATITRFCKTFHFTGYPDFRMKLSTDLAQQQPVQSYQDIVEGNTLDRIITAIEANHIRSITDTTRILDYEQLSRTIAVLHSARHIAIFGMATSGTVAQDFMQKLVRIGKLASAHADSHMQITSASSLTEQDVAFAISYSGETPETIDALRCAKERGCTTISLTQYSVSTLSRIADIPLFTSSLEEGMRRGDMASRIAQLHVIDILFTSLVSEHFGEYVPSLENAYQHVTKYRRDKGR